MILLDIRDDGCGFDSHSVNVDKGIGLRNMRERVELLGGEFSLISKKGEGVRLKAQLINEL
jgi:two-component system NarL family sensor kinase